MTSSNVPISIFVLEDLPEGLRINRLVELNKSDTYWKYLTEIRDELKKEAELKGIEINEPELVFNKETYRNIDTILTKQAYDIAILDYNLEEFNGDKNGWSYMPELLKRNSHCEVILVTTDETIENDINMLGHNIRDMISELPNIVYISKSFPEEEFNNRIYSHVKEKIKNIKRRRELQQILVDSAQNSYKAFMEKTVGELIQPSIKNVGKYKDIREKEISVKEDTLKLDRIAEDVITDNFKPLIHSDDIVICTEELGVTNQLIYRVKRPKFYIFSDPLDGSSAMKTWINETSITLSQDEFEKIYRIINNTNYPRLSNSFKIVQKTNTIIYKKSSKFKEMKEIFLKANSSDEWRHLISRFEGKIEEKFNKKFEEIIKDDMAINNWIEKFGPIELNAPMISIVLSERHQVVSNVIVNIFTGDLYVSDDSGNYKSKINPTTYTYEEKIPLKFKTFSDETEKLFICTLQAAKYNESLVNEKWQPQDFQFLIHFRECLQSIIPPNYELEKSFKKRCDRNDFTPGPGRILFLTEVADLYSAKIKEKDGKDEIYSCLLSSGEPLTEWVGWFAFLRHVPNLTAYCLRHGSDSICQHKIKRANIKGTMMPVEVASLFKSGTIDFEVLHTGYKEAMHNYTDSIVVFFKEDKSWKKLIERKLANKMPEVFVKIEV